LEFTDQLFAVKSFENCVNVPRAAVKYLYFGGDDPPINLPVQFLVTLKDVKKCLSAAQIAQDFLPFGSVDVKTINSSQVLVAVSHRKRARDVVKAFSRNKFYYVRKYNWWYDSKDAKSYYWYSGSLLTGGLLCAGLFYFTYKR